MAARGNVVTLFVANTPPLFFTTDGMVCKDQTGACPRTDMREQGAGQSTADQTGTSIAAISPWTARKRTGELATCSVVFCRPRHRSPQQAVGFRITSCCNGKICENSKATAKVETINAHRVMTTT
jgi:hypothetical protein